MTSAPPVSALPALPAFKSAWRPGDDATLGRPVVWVNKFIDAASGAKPFQALRAFAYCQIAAALRLVLPSALADVNRLDLEDDGFAEVYERVCDGLGLQRVVLPSSDQHRAAGGASEMGEILKTWNPGRLGGPLPLK
jgi:hypothetical protein